MSMPRSDRTLALRGVQPPLYQAMLALAKSQDEKARAQGMLGYALSALGRREQALAATQEAVELYRPLAQQNPQAFLPGLARSLNNLGDRLKESVQTGQALAAYEEAVRILVPFYSRLPSAFEGQMRYMVRDYVEACRVAGREPDAALVQAVRQALG